MSIPLKAHVAVNVSNIDRSVAFYRAFFGQEPAKIRADYAKFEIEDPPLNFTLNQATSEGDRPSRRSAGAVNHLGIQVASTESVDSAARRLTRAGLLTREERDTDCCYALQDKVWAEDPDGHAWEIFVVKQADTGPDAGRANGCCQDTCCSEESAV